MSGVVVRGAATGRCTHAINERRTSLRHPQLPNDRPAPAGRRALAAALGRTAPEAAGTARSARLSIVAAARRTRGDFDRDDDYVAFDDEEDWEQQGSTVQAPGLGPILQTALRGVSAISARLTDVAVQLAPADASPAVVRVAVNAGLVLLALSFVKSVLSFFLTLGSIVLGAYVAVKVFGVDVAGVSGGLGGSDSGGKGRAGGGRPKSASKRRPDSRVGYSEFKGLLGSGKDEDGLLDVWFERKGSGSGGGKAGGSKDKRRR